MIYFKMKKSKILLILISILFVFDCIKCSRYCLCHCKETRGYWVYEFQENFEKAIEQLELCLNSDLLDIDVYYHLGSCYFKMSNYGLSAKYFREANLLIPEIKSSYKLESIDTFIKAEQFYNRAIYDSAAIYYEKSIPSHIGICILVKDRQKLSKISK